MLSDKDLPGLLPHPFSILDCFKVLFKNYWKKDLGVEYFQEDYWY